MLGDFIFDHGVPDADGWVHGHVDIDLDAELELTTPVLPPFRHQGAHLRRLRPLLRDGVPFDWDGQTLPPLAFNVQSQVHYLLRSYLQYELSGTDRVYVLEFQGRSQYCKFGHSKNLLARVAEHMTEATSYGYVLLNAWASPGVADARELEQVALGLGHDLVGAQPYRERFYDMPYKKALSIARTVFEFNSDWPTPRLKASI